MLCRHGLTQGLGYLLGLSIVEDGAFDGQLGSELGQGCFQLLALGRASDIMGLVEVNITALYNHQPKFWRLTYVGLIPGCWQLEGGGGFGANLVIDNGHRGKFGTG